MEHILSYDFFRNALMGASLTAIVCGLVGSYIVVRRLVFISGGITHASFGGVGLGLFLGTNPLFMAAVVAIGAGLGVDALSRRGGVRQDSAIAVVWALGMAMGVLFLNLTPGYTADLSAYLFGNILLINHTDLIYLAGLALLIIVFFVRFYREILYTAFDPDFARTRRLPVILIERTMLVVICLAIVLSIRLVGIMLLLSLLTLPQSIVNLFTRDLCKIALWSIALALVVSVMGLLGSYYWALPSGAFIILLLVTLFPIARLVSRYVETKQKH